MGLISILDLRAVKAETRFSARLNCCNDGFGLRNELALAAQALSILCGMLSIFELAVSDLRDFRFGDFKLLHTEWQLRSIGGSISTPHHNFRYFSLSPPAPLPITHSDF